MEDTCISDRHSLSSILCRQLYHIEIDLGSSKLAGYKDEHIKERLQDGVVEEQFMV